MGFTGESRIFESRILCLLVSSDDVGKGVQRGQGRVEEDEDDEQARGSRTRLKPVDEIEKR
jgi:hypothetical protein